MIFRPFNPSNSLNPAGNSRKVIATMILTVALALTCVPASHALMGFDRPTIDAPERMPRQGLVRFLLRVFGFAGGIMDPNGQH